MASRRISDITDQHSYFSKVINLFKRQENVGKTLSKAGIVPSDEKLYSVCIVFLLSVSNMVISCVYSPA